MNTLHIELIFHNQSKIASNPCLIPLITKHLESINLRSNLIISDFDGNKHSVLKSQLKAIIIGEIEQAGPINLDHYQVTWHPYVLDLHGPQIHVEDGDENDQIQFSTHLQLPAEELFSSWENLYYDNNIKQNLLQYARTMMEFSDRGVDNNIISCNRVILLHGPPGTGKTSLCKALAQKLSIRMQDRYTGGILIEINSHSLFSKWFSESGKLVTKMFSKIRDIVENPNLLVCVLIDEVESLAHARSQCLSGNEPSDSIRVVNAVLTQIDQIKRHSNVLIFTTSNITESIDIAFVDRADIKQYLGLPSTRAIYKVYYSCLEEFTRVNIINNEEMVEPVESAMGQEIASKSKSTNKLIEICEKSVGLSGRSLRKIPFIAHALFLKKTPVDINEYLEALGEAVTRERKEREHFTNLPKY